MLRSARNQVRFMREFLRNPGEVGAVAQSSAGLSRGMIAHLGAIAPGSTIIELGPGTGVFTERLIAAHPECRIVSVECNASFCASLSERFPSIEVIQGCASELRAHIQALGREVSEVAGVVSGLPFLSLPQELGERILAAVVDVLDPGQRFVTFTYSKRAWRDVDTGLLQRLPTQRVWMNLPPAHVLPFERQAAPADLAA